MSKSLKRVRAALEVAGHRAQVLEMPTETRTAADAARAAGCELDQIAKSIVFQGRNSGQVYLFVTAGGRQVDVGKASALAGEPLTRADAQAVRARTGFAIGGVAPVGHLTPSPTFLDRRLADFQVIWAAGGTPRHVFATSAAWLTQILGVQPTDFTL